MAYEWYKNDQNSAKLAKEKLKLYRTWYKHGETELRGIGGSTKALLKSSLIMISNPTPNAL